MNFEPKSIFSLKKFKIEFNNQILIFSDNFSHKKTNRKEVFEKTSKSEEIKCTLAL
jgi:hypothetical protein